MAVHLENSNVHEQIVRKIQSLVDEDFNQNTAIKRVLKKSDAYFEDLFNDNYFEINDKSEKKTSDNEDADGGD